MTFKDIILRLFLKQWTYFATRAINLSEKIHISALATVFLQYLISALLNKLRSIVTRTDEFPVYTVKIGSKTLLVREDVLCIGQLKVPGKHLACVLEPCFTHASFSPRVLQFCSKHRAIAPYRSSLNLQNNKFQDNTAQAD